MTEEIKHSNWKLRKGQIIAAKQMTATEKWFDIKLEDGSLDHEPGQFVQVELYGIGEATEKHLWQQSSLFFPPRREAYCNNY